MALKVNALSEPGNLEHFTALRASVKPGVVKAQGEPQFPAQANEAVLFSFADILRRNKEEISQPGFLKPAIYGMICSEDGKIWIISNHGLIFSTVKLFSNIRPKKDLRPTRRVILRGEIRATF